MKKRQKFLSMIIVVYLIMLIPLSVSAEENGSQNNSSTINTSNSLNGITATDSYYGMINGIRNHKKISNVETEEYDSNALLEKSSIETSELNSFNYLLYKPENTNSNMPLIIYLHGGSGKGDDLDLLTNNDGFPKFLQDGLVSKIPAYVVIPQLPSNKKGWTDVKVSVKELVDFVSETYNINTNKISLTGHSMGGTGVWGIAISYPNIFSSIAPLSGSVELTKSKIDTLSNTPVWAFVGSADTIVDPTSSIHFIARLKVKNNNAQITIFGGATHFDVPELTYLDENIGLVDWLISNSK